MIMYDDFLHVEYTAKNNDEHKMKSLLKPCMHACMFLAVFKLWVTESVSIFEPGAKTLQPNIFWNVSHYSRMS